MQKFRLSVWYEGRVQGVGFRYKALQTAKGYEVVGEVENLADGRVKLTAIGDESEVRAFEQNLSSLMADFIHRKETREDALPDTKHKDFSIKL